MTATHTETPRPGARRRRPDLFTIFLTLACAVLAVEVLILASENRKLKAQVASMPPQRDPAFFLKPGDEIGAMRIFDDAGAERAFAFDDADGRPTLALVQSDGCGYCDIIKPAWARIGELPEAGSVRIVSLYLDRPSADALAAARAASPYECHVIANPGETALVRVPQIPATVLIDPRGVVMGAWFGALSPEQEEQVHGALRLLSGAAP